MVSGDGHTAGPKPGSGKADRSFGSFEVIATNRLNDPDLQAVMISVRDIGPRRALEEELHRQAFTDSLTGLPNRALLHDRLEDAVARRRDGAAVFVLVVTADAPNRLWLTTSPTGEGKLYLSARSKTCTPAGSSATRSTPASTFPAVSALRNAVRLRDPVGTIVYSDGEPISFMGALESVT